jgi:hypothetical protein
VQTKKSNQVGCRVNQNQNDKPKPKSNQTQKDSIPSYNKVEKILKSSLDLILSPSPLVKLQIMGRKVRLRCECNQLLKNKKFVDITQQCFALLPQVKFPIINLNFHLG